MLVHARVQEKVSSFASLFSLDAYKLEFRTVAQYKCIESFPYMEEILPFSKLNTKNLRGALRVLLHVPWSFFLVLKNMQPHLQ